MGHPPLHFLVGKLTDERLGLLQALAHSLHRVDREAWMAWQQLVPSVHGPGQRDAVDHGSCCSRIVRAAEGLSDAEEITCTDHPDHGLLALRGQMRDPEAPKQEHEELLGDLSLFKHRRAGFVAPAAGTNQDIVEIVLGHSREQRQVSDKGSVETGGHDLRRSDARSDRHIGGCPMGQQSC